MAQNKLIQQTQCLKCTVGIKITHADAQIAQVDCMAQYEQDQQAQYLKCTVETLHGTVGAKPRDTVTKMHSKGKKGTC